MFKDYINFFIKIWNILNKNLFLILGSIFLTGILGPILYNSLILKYYDVIYHSFKNLQMIGGNKSLLGHDYLSKYVSFVMGTEVIHNLVIFFVFYLLMQSVFFLSNFLLSKSLPVIQYRLKRFAFWHAMNLNLNFFSSKNPADIERNVTNLAESVCSLIEYSLFIISRISSIIFCLYCCLIIKATFLIFTVWIIIMIIVMYSVFKIVLGNISSKNNYQNAQSGFVTEVFGNISLYKIVKCKNFIQNKFNNNQSFEDKAYEDFNLSFGIGRFILGLTNIGCFCLSLYGLTRLYIIYPQINLTFFFLQFWNVAICFWDILWSIIPVFHNLGKFNTSYKFMQLEEPNEEKEQYLTEIKAVKINNLSFSYDEDSIFNNLSFESNNNFILLDGPSGSGKTTLMNSLSGLDKVSSGTINFKDKEIYKNIDNISNLHQFISFLPQKDMIFNESILNNIVLDRDYDAQKLNNLLEMMNFSEFIALGEIDKKQCGVNGSQISGGQAKRVCICRTLLFDSEEKMLFLDEPFNNLNQAIITNLINYLKSLKGQKTIICVDHTGFFKEIADQIIPIK